jgi:uncharacterized protein (TIGR02001 family)
MKTTSFKLTALALIGLLAMDMVTAQTAPAAAPKAPEPDYTISYNLGATTDYRYRGMSQSRLKPALQGGVDYAHKNGVYVGAWVSSISWIKDAGQIQSPTVDTGASTLEIDVYGGYKTEVAKDVTLDVGALQYWYPSNKYNAIAGASNANTLEFYGAITAGLFTLKYSRAQTNLFGVSSTAASSKGSSYLDLSATIEIDKGLTLVPHYGSQTVKNFSDASYSDYGLTINKDVDGVVYSAALVSVTSKKITGNPGEYMNYSPEGKNLGKGAIIFSIKKNF